jgi:hypothetical protein
MYIDCWLWLLFQIPITSLLSTIAMAISWITVLTIWNGLLIQKMPSMLTKLAYTNPMSVKDGSYWTPVQGETYTSIKKAAVHLNINYATCRNYLSGHSTNRTCLQYAA